MDNKLDCMRHAGKVNQYAIQWGFERALPGKTLSQVDFEVHWYITIAGKCGAAFKGYQPPGYPSPFPGTACLSPNDVVVHGIPNDYILKPGDLLTIDVGTEHNGWFVDAARSRVIPGASTELEKENERKSVYLIDATEAILKAQLSVIHNECTLLEIAEISDKVAEQYSVVLLPQFGGHQIGDKIHIDPFIPNTIDRKQSKVYQQLEMNKFARTKLYEGQTICLEPVASFGNTDIIVDADMWTVRKKDGNLTAHSERCILITKDGFELLS